MLNHSIYLLFKLRYPFVVIFLIAPMLSNCSGNEDQRNFERDALNVPSGYTQTDAIGEITGSVDRDDWRIAPNFQAFVSNIQPAHPNPVQSTETVNIEITLFGNESVNGIQVVEWADGSIVHPPLYEDLNIPLSFQTIINISANQFGRFDNAESRRGLKRVLIFDGRNNLISYGDIMVE